MVKLAITREQSLQIHESKSKRTWLEAIEAVSFRRIATVEQLLLEQTHTHTHCQLYRIPRAATPQGIAWAFVVGIVYNNTCLNGRLLWQSFSSGLVKRYIASC